MVMNKIGIYRPFGQIWPHVVGELSIIIPKKFQHKSTITLFNHNMTNDQLLLLLLLNNCWFNSRKLEFVRGTGRLCLVSNHLKDFTQLKTKLRRCYLAVISHSGWDSLGSAILIESSHTHTQTYWLNISDLLPRSQCGLRQCIDTIV